MSNDIQQMSPSDLEQTTYAAEESSETPPIRIDCANAEIVSQQAMKDAATLLSMINHLSPDKCVEINFSYLLLPTIKIGIQNR
jgi:hypothetical protein